ncbi:MAG: ATP-binding cassette domain-containing protein [Clostridia bacterium]|nr:ATP-binding cassette domain-containing protein [Clostridia bacterium]
MIIKNLNFAYGEKVIFQDLNMELPTGGVTCIMGGSGAGKTTLLNCISRQLRFDGNIEYDKDGVSFAYVFQQPRLIPSMTVEDNIKFVLPKDLSKEQIQERVNDIIVKLQLEECRKSYPGKISGGQAGRASLARALVTDCDVLLMDEPFKGLDVKLKKEILNLLIPLIRQKSVVFVTHDVEEALAIADRVFVFERKENSCVRVKGQIDVMQCCKETTCKDESDRDMYGEKLNQIRKEIYGLLTL